MNGASGRGGRGWRYRVATDRSRPGAIGVIDLLGDADLLPEIGLPKVEPGAMRLADLWGVDRGLVVRWSAGFLQVMPHGGPAVVKAVVCALEARGVVRAGLDERALSALYPEVRDRIEGRMLAVLAEAQSPLAIDLLLRQPGLWRAGGKSDPARDRVLSRLIEPALVAAVGPANIGKSTLLNTLAGRSVAAVADEPGTTRDHVGLLLEVGGLTVRYVDTPGIREGVEGGVEAEAGAIATEVVQRADLVLECTGECGTGGLPESAGRGAWGMGCGGCVIRVGLRRDLGPPAGAVDVEVSAQTGAGIAELAGLIRERLVPAGLLEGDTPWRFWMG